MPYSVVDKPTEYFNTKLYTGNGTFPQAFTGVGFKPDFVWIKRRSATASHVLSDSVRGVTKTLYTDSTSAELTSDTYGWVSAFGSDGFSVDQSGSSGENVNASGSTYASWNWLGANTTVSNTSGTITSTVSANTTSGFSIVSYTSTNVLGTIGHGLGVAPKMIIFKNRTNGVAQWAIYHASIGASNSMNLNTTAASAADSGRFNNTAPTSSVFTVNTSSATNDTAGQTFIAYCFADVKGYSKFGSYTGNGSANGTFVYTGFTPAFVLIKQSSAAGEFWILSDNKRVADYNVTDARLFPNSANAESSNGSGNIDFLSNGFKIRNSDSPMNASSATYIYMCFASNPFVSSKGIPTTAR